MGFAEDALWVNGMFLGFREETVHRRGGLAAAGLPPEPRAVFAVVQLWARLSVLVPFPSASPWGSPGCRGGEVGLGHPNRHLCSQSAHMAMVDALMMAYTVEMISIEKVVASVQRFSTFSASKELPYDLEDAMVFWVNKVSAGSRGRCEDWGRGSSPRAARAGRGAPWWQVLPRELRPPRVSPENRALAGAPGAVGGCAVSRSTSAPVQTEQTGVLVSTGSVAAV